MKLWKHNTVEFWLDFSQMTTWVWVIAAMQTSAAEGILGKSVAVKYWIYY